MCPGVSGRRNGIDSRHNFFFAVKQLDAFLEWRQIVPGTTDQQFFDVIIQSIVPQIGIGGPEIPLRS
jgi:hypothetical protein